MEFVHAVGSERRGDIEAIEEALRSVYGVGVDELEGEFVKYCAKR